MLKYVIPAAAVLGLIAFSARTETPAFSAAPYEAQSEAAVMGWHLSREGAMAKLAYGVANSDQLALMLTCEPGERAAVVYGSVQPDTPALISAASTPSEVDPLSGAIAARLPLNDPSLRKLARDGQMNVEGDAGKFSLAATKAEQRAVGEFLAYCANGVA
ncbi:hypothetical protein JIP62_03160 [Brevundimonas vitis]|uniref:Uncharacterized protein n=1 Tax=Brevundimonas vitisensis TaxID=2800818 RepID=A0ABX7BNG7_9CAUL|nr:hypothetical protein [Brevundimonas vitisensis]QQQ19134.1 hypothetical protein JIP62_03160 [Brevundimonas vitisensis]